MNRSDTENKMHGTVKLETKEEAGAATCGNKSLHRLKLGSTCETCGTALPMEMAFTSDEYQLYFAPPAAEPTHQDEAAEQVAALWRAHEVAARAYEDAAFAVADLRRGRSQLSGRYVGADGNTVEDHSVFARGARADQAIAEAVAVREKRREEDAEILQQIQRVDAVRRSRHLRALHLESFPEAAPSRTVLDRVSEAVRGG